MGTPSVPWWVLLLVGVLTFLGAVAGAWGAQVINGRNEARRWQQERDREAQAFWRDKRLEIYSTVLGTAENTVRGLGVATGLEAWTVWDDEDLPVTMEHIGADLRRVSILGSPAAVEQVTVVRGLAHSLFSSVRHPSRSRRTEPMHDLGPRLDALHSAVRALRDQFRTDLDVSPTAETVPAPVPPRKRAPLWARLRARRAPTPAQSGDAV